jgi:CDP-diacylglycerol--serine O-phosphatidyltransferase
MVTTTETPTPIRRGIYLLPSLITAANMSAGFVSVLYSIGNNFNAAAWAIMAAIALDMMDGRIARWTKSTSRFGVEFDSLSDLISFGVAPAVMMYQMVLHTMHEPGIAIALFFVVAGAMRLARFNVKAQEGEGAKDFIGLPIPAAAGMLASFVLSYELFADGTEITVKTIPMVMKRMPFFFNILPVFMILIAALMISPVPYMAFKKFKPNRPKSLQIITLVMMCVLLIITYPQNTIFILFLVYLLSGIIGYVWRYWRLRRALVISFKRRQSDRAEQEEKK